MPKRAEERSPVPKTLLDFQEHFANEEACNAYLYGKRFSEGFVCHYCEHHEKDVGPPFTFVDRPTVYRCRYCKRDTSLTARTIMHRSRQPLRTWFLAAFFMTGLTPGMSAVQLKKMLGIKRYETAFNMLHKLRAAMVRPERDPIGQKFPVEVDETFVGGATQGKGHGVTDQVLVVGAVEVMPRRESEKWGGQDPNFMGDPLPTHRGGHGRKILAGRLRLQVVPDRKQETLIPFIQANVTTSAEVRTDGWIAYEPLNALGYRHKAVAIRGDHAKTDKHLPMIHITFGNLGAWLLGTHHGVSSQHLQAYLNEFVFRFNRRFWPMAAFDSLLGIAARMAAPTYEGLYGGTWTHPGVWHE
jgi:transposase-like protein